MRCRKSWESLESLDPLDILWENIQLQYAAILRAQRIMWVKNHDDMTKETNFDGEKGTGYLVQMAWDKQSRFYDCTEPRNE